MKTARRITVLLLATAALAGCSSDPDDGNDVPSSWIRRQYATSGADYVDSRDTPSRVAQEIDGHTAARDRLSDNDMVFLRYRNDIVAISPHASGSRIEIADYRTGYRRWRPHIRSVWPDPDSDTFRGGGPGSGK
ncbi:DUF4247 domain-containing protein [Streptomyces sp. TRM49041]|uniref:DUF4247 domain-containing protein n=1 Tax=Streptomyces sp. TRM49041 TaxID=2603216 RepID=UPI0011ECFB75|nr:DUF4247 domain-containing protein [Streptomyces sp. TRM49041]